MNEFEVINPEGLVDKITAILADGSKITALEAPIKNNSEGYAHLCRKFRLKIDWDGDGEMPDDIGYVLATKYNDGDETIEELEMRLKSAVNITLKGEEVRLPACMVNYTAVVSKDYVDEEVFSSFTVGAYVAVTLMKCLIKLTGDKPVRYLKEKELNDALPFEFFRK